MKKFKLDLSEYTVPDLANKGGGEITYPLRNNLSDFLRTVGMFKTSIELVDAVMLAREISKTTSEFLLLDEKEARILRSVVDKLVSLTAEGKAQLGGVLHEEVICRVVNMEEIGE